MSLPKCQLNELVMTDPSLRSLDQARLFSIILNRSMASREGWCVIDQASLSCELGIARRRVHHLIKGLSKWVEVKSGRGRGNKTQYRPRYELLDEDENAHCDTPFNEEENAHQDVPFGEKNADEKAQENAHHSGPQTLKREKIKDSSSPNPSTDAEGDGQGADSNSGLGKDRSGTARARRQPTVTRGWQVPGEVLKLPPACNLQAEEIEERRKVFVLKHDGSIMANPVGAFLKDLEAYCRFERGKPRSGNVVPLKPAEPAPRWLINPDDREHFANRGFSEYRKALADAGLDRTLPDGDQFELKLQLIKVAGGADIAIGIRPDCMVDAEKFVMALAPEAMLTDKQRAAG